MENMAGKNAAVVGAGASGIAAGRLLLSEGAQVTFFDERPRESVFPTAESMPPGALYAQRLPSPGDLEGLALLVLSPGVPPRRLPLAEARALGVAVQGELETAFRRFRGKVAAVTGTNGKSTVTTLVGEMAKLSFPRVFVGGNLGTPFAEAAGGDYDWAVVECSSYQLESIDSFRPAVAALLNVTEDHRDRYAGIADYAAAKMEIFRNMGPGDGAVLNADDPEVSSRAPSVRADRLWFSLLGPVERGVFLDGGEMVARLGGPEERYPRSLLRIKGSQNVENAMAAVAVARRMGVPPEAVRQVLASFPGLPHRIEFVAGSGGVAWYNDSKGTNVGAVLKALEGFSETVVLVAGGKDKGVDFRPLREPLLRKARGVVLVGEAKERMARELAGTVPLATVSTLAEAVAAAASMARPGDVVVFSPACSSFDMFRNFEERGEAFRAAVREFLK
jgi:UDP-N-acetylmuramoylalanine--D-glutamate ligase